MGGPSWGLTHSSHHPSQKCSGRRMGFALTPEIAERCVGALARADPRERGQRAVLRAVEELVHVVSVLGRVGGREGLDVGLVLGVVVDHHPIVAALLQRVEDRRLRELLGVRPCSQQPSAGPVRVGGGHSPSRPLLHSPRVH